LARFERMIIRIDATLPHLATKAELADIRAAMSDRFSTTGTALADLPTETRGRFSTMATTLADLRSELGRKPGRGYMWTVMAALTAAYTAAFTAARALLTYLVRHQ
jgi:hypothetical protein